MLCLMDARFICPRREHDAVAKLKQREWRWFSVAATSCRWLDVVRKDKMGNSISTENSH